MENLNLSNNIIDSVNEQYLRSFIEKILNEKHSIFVKNKNSSELNGLFPFIEIEENGLPLKDYISFIENNILPTMAETSSPRNFANMSSIPPSFIVELSRLITYLSQNLMKFNSSGGLTLIEKQLLAMLHMLFYSEEKGFYKKNIYETCTAMGVITSCGSISNISAMYLAAEKVGFSGLNRYKNIVKNTQRKVAIIGSELMHYSFDRAASLLGVDLIKVPIDVNYQIDLLELEREITFCKKNKIKIISLVGVAGSTDVGSVDDLAALGKIASRENIFFHIDAAWGGALFLSEQYQDKLIGIDLADSITIDGHKQFMCPIGLGVLLVKNPNDSLNICHYADYAIRKYSMDLGVFSIEGSRPANSLYLYTILKVYGRKNLEDILNKKMSFANFFVSLINKNDSFELISDAYTNMATFRYLPTAYREKNVLYDDDNFKIDEFNLKLHELQEKQGECIIARTKLWTKKYDKEILVLRVIFSNNYVSEQDILLMIKELESLANLIALEHVS